MDRDKKIQSSGKKDSSSVPQDVGSSWMGNGNAPRGLEILIKKASIDAVFYERLINARSAAADDIQLTLNPSEKAMLDSIPKAQLEAIIKNTRVTKDQKQAALLGKAAGIILLTAMIVPGCHGSRPEYERFNQMDSQESEIQQQADEPNESSRTDSNDPDGSEEEEEYEEEEYE